MVSFSRPLKSVDLEMEQLGPANRPDAPLAPNTLSDRVSGTAPTKGTTLPHHDVLTKAKSNTVFGTAVNIRDGRADSGAATAISGVTTPSGGSDGFTPQQRPTESKTTVK